ncbi:MAG: FAD-binding oxidoreductase [Promethearchaeia archaeon]|nr:MAG: FAD-binding oxidoreductase [Candidatus Lokiarchaeia archaeon]
MTEKKSESTKINALFSQNRRIPEKEIPEIVSELSKIFPTDRISCELADKIAYSKDYWLIGNLFNLKGQVPAYPDIIVWPKTEEEVSQLLKYASQHNPPLPIIPYGEGSGVVGGAIPIFGGIMVDMKYFDHIKINPVNMTAQIGAGVNGKNLERYLNKRGYRMGHIPQSLYTSTVGGYFSHRAAGQFSGKYGKFEDIVKSFHFVLPSGEILKTKFYPRAAVGPMIDKMFIGSEGTLGIVTEVTCKIWPYPEKQVGLSFVFDDLNQCLDAIRKTLQGQINPAVIRIYDKLETKRHFGKTEKRSKNKLMVIFVCEGPTEVVELEEQVVRRNCLYYQGVECGDKPVQHWFETRFVVKESSEFSPYGLVLDTIEVAIPWERANELYNTVVERVMKLPGVIMVSGHASHFYTTGVCFYFTFTAVPEENQSPLDLYNLCWDTTVATTLECGGAISHHHGIGINRTRWMKLEHKGEFKILQQIKKLLDPMNIMNPGKLYIDLDNGNIAEKTPLNEEKEIGFYLKQKMGEN